MPSKKSKPTGTRNSRSSVARTCSETELRTVAAEIAEIAEAAFRKKEPFPRVILRGPMGAGKSTFARTLLDQLRVDRASEGSPTFAIAHEYRTAAGFSVIHADGYRLRSEAELEETGLVESMWEPERLLLFEWMDLFPETEAALFDSDLPVIEVILGFSEKSPLLREVQVVSRISEKN